MTSIYDIPHGDIEIFLLANNKSIRGNDEDYELALVLLKDKKAKGHTTSIIEWTMAYNLLVDDVDIPIYSTYDIDNMPQAQIDRLAKLLTMKRNNRENIKNILRYLGKLQDDKQFLIGDINQTILDTLTQLELQAIDISKLSYNDVINLLKTHRNKKAIRNFIFDSLEKIIIYNSIYLDFEDNDYDYDYLKISYLLF